MQHLIAPIAEELIAGRAVCLSGVIARHGSLPMSRCAKMVVLASGDCHGTVGGGCLEAEVYAGGKELIRSGGARIERYSLTEVESGIDGHVCGGTVEILSESLQPDADTVALFARLRELMQQRRPTVLATLLPGADPGRSGHLLVEAGGTCRAAGSASNDPDLVGNCMLAFESGRPELLRSPEGDPECWIEPLLPAPTVVVFGAGHCGRAIGQAAAAVNFRVVMLDDRPPFLDPQRMPWAEEIERVDFDGPLVTAGWGPEPYLVIVTRGHEHDLTLLRQLAPMRSAYLGMIGSRRKRHLFEKTLAAEGFDAAAIARLRSPMGLDIGADTPEEIAVAVVAEMIAVRRRADKPAAASGSTSADSAGP